MKAFLASMLLTVVCFSFNSWADPGGCGVNASHDIDPNQNKCNTGYYAHLYSVGGGTQPGTTNAVAGEIKCECLSDSTASTLQTTCANYQKNYGDHANSAQKDLTADQKKAQDDIAKQQNDVQKAQEDATEKVQKIKEDIQKLDSDYQNKNLDRQKDQQKETMSAQDQMRKQDQEITKMTNQLPLAQQGITSAQNAYNAVVSANSVSMVRMKCMSIIRKWMKDSGYGSTIRGGSANAGSQQAMINDQWTSCIATEQANADTTISNAASQVLTATSTYNGLNAELTAAKSARAQMDSVNAQQTSAQQQATSQGASQYYQQKLNLQTSLQNAQTNANQKITNLNTQMQKKNMLNMQQQMDARVNKQLDGDLKAYQAACCKGDKPVAGLNAETAADQDDEDEGTGGMCSQKTTAQSAPRNASTETLMQLLNTGLNSYGSSNNGQLFPNAGTP